jgi:hypothetical protein
MDESDCNSRIGWFAVKGRVIGGIVEVMLVPNRPSRQERSQLFRRDQTTRFFCGKDVQGCHMYEGAENSVCFSLFKVGADASDHHAAHIIPPTMRNSQVQMRHGHRYLTPLGYDSRGGYISIIAQRFSATQSEKILQAMRPESGKAPVSIHSAQTQSQSPRC